MTTDNKSLPPLPTPEEWHEIRHTRGDFYTAAKLQEYGDARADHARKVALEEAARVCLLTVGASDNTARQLQAQVCASSINRLLK